VALDAVTFSVGAGQICTVIGPNGAGKSTLFRVLTGLTTPTHGSVEVAGLDPVREGHRIRRLVGFMPADDRSLYLRHTCRENLVFHGRLQGMAARTLRVRVDEALDLVGLSEARDRVGFALSSGMRARLQLARALLHEPAVLILDEPTGAIDPVGAADLLLLIQQISKERGLATLISSHRVEEIEALKDNLILLDKGRVLYRGDLETVRREWEQPRFRIVFADEGVAAAGADRLGSAVDCLAVVREGARLVASMRPGSTGPLAALGDLVPSVTTVLQDPMPLGELMRKVLRAGGPSA
jgi:ABC-2 type transport system ATP-binding protein